MNLIYKPLKYLIVVAILLGLVEVFYINRIVNFHSGTFSDLNPASEMTAKQNLPVILVLGDEVSANPDSYVAMLRVKHPGYKIINGALPNTGIIEMENFGEKLIKEHNPDILIYQVNPANDLYDLRKGTDKSEASLLSGISNSITDNFKFLDYLSYKISNTANNLSGQSFDGLEPENIPYAEKINIKALGPETYERQTGLIENSTLLKTMRQTDMETLMARMNNLFCKMKNGSKVFVLVTPHCSWIDKYYMDNMSLAGVELSEDFVKFSGTYPFVKVLSSYYFSNQKVKVVDPSMMLRHFDSPSKRLFKLRSNTLNRNGHEVMCSTISGFIRLSI
ncbi:MAG: hypothetical protein IPJ75_07735 [Ignavibacteriales bacterium]|nr:hypothetical protein [Ignavibacteriales bacterium]